jgi:DNA-directed RNA polymerase specialized sigma24 family protein
VCCSMSQPSSPRLSVPLPADERQAENRRRLREFLRAIPRSEPDSTVELLGPTEALPTLTITRAELTAAIEQLRPRMRQIIHRTLEEGWSREDVCASLHIGMRTLERDQAGGLDLLIGQAQLPR